VVVVVTLAIPPVASATTYYVAPTGSDAGPGTSPATAWQTVKKVNAFALSPGDTVLFVGGSTFTDAALSPSRSGSLASAITFGSFGTGRATISSGVSLSGSDHLKITDLRFTAPVAGSADGITLERNKVILPAGNASIAVQATGGNWRIANNTIQHAGSTGISVSGRRTASPANVILNSGSNSTAGAERYGIAVHADDTAITGNVIQNFGSSGVWLDAPNDTVQNNYIANSHHFATLQPRTGSPGGKTTRPSGRARGERTRSPGRRAATCSWRPGRFRSRRTSRLDGTPYCTSPART
jgi:hypothetical protein